MDHGQWQKKDVRGSGAERQGRDISREIRRIDGTVYGWVLALIVISLIVFGVSDIA